MLLQVSAVVPLCVYSVSTSTGDVQTDHIPQVGLQRSMRWIHTAVARGWRHHIRFDHGHDWAGLLSTTGTVLHRTREGERG